MSDLHHLPLMGRDIPTYEPNVPFKQRVQVFKAGCFWQWEHNCSREMRERGGPDLSHAKVLSWAMKHAEECL